MSATRVCDLQEERGAWLLLARQAVMDVQYLDKAAADCAPRQLLPLAATGDFMRMMAIVDDDDEC